jgi:hypothetical protein
MEQTTLNAVSQKIQRAINRNKLARETFMQIDLACLNHDSIQNVDE